MARLPQPGSDTNQWGDILNDFLHVSHDDGGRLKNDTVGNLQLQDASVTNAKIGNIDAAKVTSGVIEKPRLPDLSDTYTITDDTAINVMASPYNAKGDGIADDTSAIQDAIDACPDGGVVILPGGTYKISAPLSLTKNMRLIGRGVHPIFGTLSSQLPDTFDAPNVSPYLKGSVLLQTTGGANAVEVTGTAKRVDLCDFGIRFADSIRHTNTGHGVYAVPSQGYLAGHDHGVFNNTWRNVTVFGHDGEHYAFYCLNTLYAKWDQLRSYGGGGYYLECDSYGGNYGNLYGVDLFADVYCGGSAHAFSLKGRTPSGAAGVLNLIQFNRIQAITEGNSSFPETTLPTSAQMLFTTTTHNVAHLTITAPDFESWTIGSPCDFDTTGSSWIDPSGIFGGTNGLYGTYPKVTSKPQVSGNGYAKVFFNDGVFRGQNSAAPAVAAGANAGTAPPSPVGVNTNSDERGLVTFGTGSGPAAGVLVRVTFAQYRGAEPLRVMLTANNAATANLGLYCVHNDSGFDICVANPPAASQASDVYSVEWATIY